MASIQELRRKKGLVYKVYWRDTSGKMWGRTFQRRRDAESFARRVEVEKEDGGYADPSLGRVTVAAFWGQFIETAFNLRPTTRALYETHARRYILPALGSRRLSSVTKADVTALVSDLVKTGTGKATIVQVVKLLHRLFQFAVDEDRLVRNPVHGVRIPQPDRREARFLSEGEVAAIAGAVPSRYRALVYTLAYTGLRIGEASALRVRNLDLTSGVIRVVESSPEVAGRKLTADTKTRKVRAVHLGPHLRHILKGHLASFGRPLDPSSYVFTGDRSAQVRQNAFRSRVFQPAAQRVGIDPIPTVHDLRHTAASLMAKAGYSMREAQDALGHSHTTMTDRYTHLFPAEAEARVQRLDALLILPKENL